MAVDDIRQLGIKAARKRYDEAVRNKLELEEQLYYATEYAERMEQAAKCSHPESELEYTDEYLYTRITCNKCKFLWRI